MHLHSAVIHSCELTAHTQVIGTCLVIIVRVCEIGITRRMDGGQFVCHIGEGFSDSFQRFGRLDKALLVGGALAGGGAGLFGFLFLLLFPGFASRLSMDAAGVAFLATHITCFLCPLARIK